MTVSSSTSKTLYTGNGALKVYPYTFRILDESEIRVTVDDIDSTITTDYTVSGVGDAAGGNITFIVAPVNLSSIVLIRNMGFLQETDLQENDSLPAETLETSLDRSTMEAQQIKEQQDRALTISEDQTSSTVVPDFVANNYLKVNGAGNAVEWDTISTSGGGIAAVVEDTTPQLGGDLDTNAKNINFDDNFGLTDDALNEQLIFQKTTSAVNHFEMTNAATGNGATLSTAGGDTNVDLNVAPKGTGALNVTADTNITGTIAADGSISIDGTAAAAAIIVLGEDTDNGANTTSLQAAASIASSHTYTLPGALPAADTLLHSNSSGTLTWDTPQGYELISTATASASATIEFTNLNSTYSMYKVVLLGVLPATDNTALWFRISTDNGSTFKAGASDYRWNATRLAVATTVTAGSNGDVKGQLMNSIGNVQAEAASGEVDIYNPSSAVTHLVGLGKFIYLDGLQDVHQESVSFNYRTATTAVDAIQFLMSTGNITSGVFKLYGLRS